ncbi:MAG TPA: MFS transporter [Gemmatimonadales bacterium]|nr:MFS transporter [Gemmatimonadales bacterium]
MPPQIGRALRHRNYRLFFGGQSVSLVGTWITRIATAWLVYRLTGSPFLLGLVGFCGQIPTLFLSPIAGVYVDRWNRHQVLLVTQVLSLVQSLALAVLTLAGVITVAEVLVLQLFQGCINAFDVPARQAFVITMVEDHADLPNAIALNSSMVNGARIIGPSVAGLLIAAVGEGWCFLLDAVSYVAVLASLVAMRLPPAVRRRAATRVREELVAGFRYVAGFMPIRSALLLVALVGMAGMPYSVLMPAVATKVLHGGANTYGFLMTAAGLGALAGALYLAARQSVLGLGRVIAGAALVFGLALVAFSFSRNVVLSLAILPIVGAGFMIQLASTNTILQTLVDEHLRGRVMSFYTMAFLGTAPIGSLLAGIIAEHIGATETILLGGIACAGGGIWFAARLPRLREEARPIYEARGILPLGPTPPRPAPAPTPPMP